MCVRSLELHAGCWVIVAFSALDESQWWLLYLATKGRYLSLFCPRAHPNPSPVACCLAFPSSSPSKPRLHISSETSEPIVAESIRHYWSLPRAATFRKSPKNLQLPSPNAGFHLAAVSNCFFPGYWTNASSREPSHPYFLPLVQCTKVGLPHPFGKLLQAEIRLLQADWGLAFSPTQVRRIIALIICI